jgi:hypothetical protein
MMESTPDNNSNVEKDEKPTTKESDIKSVTETKVRPTTTTTPNPVTNQAVKNDEVLNASSVKSEQVQNWSDIIQIPIS